MDDRGPLDFNEKQRLQVEAKRDAEQEARIRADDLKWVMSNKRGRRFMWRVLERAGVFRTSFTGDNATFFNEGKRDIGLMLITEIHESSPESYFLMVEEHRKKHGTNNADATRK